MKAKYDPTIGATRQAEITYEYMADPGTRPTTMYARADQLDADLARMRDQGYRILRVRIDTICGRCHGAGRVKARRRGKVIPWVWATCGACVGAPILSTLEVIR